MSLLKTPDVGEYILSMLLGIEGKESRERTDGVNRET